MLSPPQKGVMLGGNDKILTAVPYGRGLAGLKERLAAAGLGVKRVSTNQAVGSLWPVTLVPSRPSEHDSAGVLQLTFPLFPSPAPGVSLGPAPPAAWKCPGLCLCQSLEAGGSSVPSPQLSRVTLSSSPQSSC